MGLLSIVAGIGVPGLLNAEPSSDQATKSSEQVAQKSSDKATKSSEQVAQTPPQQAVQTPPQQAVSPQPSVPGAGSATPRIVVGPTLAPPPAPNVRGKGNLVLRVYPFATVFVNGLNKGETPIKPLQLPAGLHKVKFVHPDRTIEREVHVKAGQDILLKIDMLEA